jgi:hypothetical protein
MAITDVSRGKRPIQSMSAPFKKGSPENSKFVEIFGANITGQDLPLNS